MTASVDLAAARGEVGRRAGSQTNWRLAAAFDEARNAVRPAMSACRRVTGICRNVRPMRHQPSGAQRRTRALAFLQALSLTACGPSLDDLVEQLEDPEQRESARQELLLATDRSVTPLLAALEDSTRTAARPYLVDVLLSAMTRVEDGRIHLRLEHHMLTDGDPEVRARIARGLGLQGRAEAAGALLQALETETDASVRHGCLLAVNRLDGLDEDLQRRAHAMALRHASSSHSGTRMEARIRLAGPVDELLDAARKAELEADLVLAMDLYRQAVAAWPGGKRANYRLGRHLYDSGQVDEGLERLRRHGMLLDVPRFPSAPRIDGQLDEPVWASAARADTFYQFSSGHNAAMASDLRTELLAGYTSEALFIGFRGFDDHLDSLVVTDRGHDEYIFKEDMVELFIDADLDRRDYVHAGVNTRGVIADRVVSRSAGLDLAWDADGEAAAHIGDDLWSLEYRLEFGQPQLQRPRPGTVWGFNFSRTFRGQEYTQWVRTSGVDAHNPDDFGVLLFR